MKKMRIFGLLFFLLMPTLAYSQSTADKSWNAFWNRFSSAVNSKNKTAIRAMARKEFGHECANISVNEWMRNLDSRKLWGKVHRSVAGGTRSYNDIGRIPGRVTRDEFLIFGYVNRRWYFWCIMGD